MVPVSSFALALVLALAGAFAIEAALYPRGARPALSLRPGDLAIRLGCYALVTALWFAFSWRPWLAATTTLGTVTAAVLVDRLKRKVLGEPLVYTDVALLRQVPQHPELYYTTPLTHPRMAGPMLLGLVGVVAWYVHEPSVLPAGRLAALAAAAGLPLALLALLLAARGAAGRRLLARRFPAPRLAADVARYGILAILIAYTLRRDAEAALPVPVAAPARSGPAGDPVGDPVVLAVQLESFLDPERVGGPPLPLMARVRREAALYGRLAVPAHGAYTMRSEHAALTGREGESLGFAAFDPYLCLGGRDPTSLARLARAAGYETLFVHPYHRDFFDRAEVMRALGFDRLLMQDDFAGAARRGPYVADAATAAHVLAEVRARKGRLFVFCVTMENHGPWKPGRLPGHHDPLALYLDHAAASGRAMETLLDALPEALAGARATLCLFGDHPPSLPSYRPGPERPSTDYALFRIGSGATAPPRRLDLTIAGLGRRLRGTLGYETAEPEPAGDGVPRW